MKDEQIFKEALSLNAAMGSSRFYFFTHKMGQKVNRVFQTLEKQNLLTNLYWPIDNFFAKEELHWHSQAMINNHCGHLALSEGYDWAVFTDLDEIMLPVSTKHQKWADMISSLPANIHTLSCRRISIHLKTFTLNEVFSRCAVNEKVRSNAQLSVNSPSNCVSNFTSRFKINNALQPKFMVFLPHLHIIGIHRVRLYSPHFNANHIHESKNSIAYTYHYRRLPEQERPLLFQKPRISCSIVQQLPSIVKRATKICDLFFQ